MAARKHRRNPPPPPPRRSGPPSKQRVATSLARVRQISKSLPERERPFDPSRAPTWRGSSRDLVVNGSPRLTSGYAYECECSNWKRSRDDDWDTVMVGDEEIDAASYVGERRIDGSKCAVFQMPDGRTFYAQMSHMVRNGEVDPRDVPAHLRPAEINELPEHNGQDIGYSQGYSSRREEGWYQVEYATGSNYSGGSLTESNYRVLCDMLDETHPEDSEPVVWARTSGGHGTYGVVVRYGDLDEEIQDTLNALEDHPLISDDDHSELEMEQQDEAWERDGANDLSRELAKITDVDRDDLKNGLTDEEWYSVFSLASDSGGIYWEDQEGAGPYVDMRKIAKQVVKLLRDGVPGYATNEQTDAYNKLSRLV